MWEWEEQNRHILKSGIIQVMKQTFLSPQRYEQTVGSGYRFGTIKSVEDILIRQDRCCIFYSVLVILCLKSYKLKVQKIAL